MLGTMLRRILAAALMASLFGPVAAQAEDTTCRNGLFADGEGFRQARVRAQRAFFYEDADGCPAGSACRTRSYVIAGDALVVDGRMASSARSTPMKVAAPPAGSGWKIWPCFLQMLIPRPMHGSATGPETAIRK